jgi:BMFP domain-containing protein YqiC
MAKSAANTGRATLLADRIRLMAKIGPFGPDMRDELEGWAAEAQAGATAQAQLDTAVTKAWKEADDLDSNQARWVVGRLAADLGVALDFTAVNKPNNRLREQLAECEARVAELETQLADGETIGTETRKREPARAGAASPAARRSTSRSRRIG